METLTVNDWILLIVGLLALIPATELIIRFKKTKIESYLIFSGVFLLSTIFTITTIIADITNDLLFWQISFGTRNLTYLLFFIHNSRMLWKKTPTIVLFPAIALFSIIEFLTLFWTKFSDGEIGAGLILNNGIELYSTNHRLLAIIFQIYVTVIFIYAYQKINLQNSSSKLKNSILLMRSMGILLLLTRLIRFIQNFGFLINESETVNRSGAIILLLGFGVMAYAIRIKGVIFFSRVDLESLLVISKFGAPISSIKFTSEENNVSSTLISGVITAIQNVVDNMANQNDQVQFIVTGDLHITLQRYEDLMLVLITRTDPTQMLASSLKYFAKIYFKHKQVELDDFYKKGLVITDISEEIYLAFPYAAFEHIEEWN